MKESLHRLSEYFDTLGNGVRLEIVKLLHEDRHYVKELAEKLDRSQKTISKHLRILRKDGLVQAETVSQNRYYELKRPELIKQTLDLLGNFERTDE